jgi:hypothetical protein
LIVPSDFAASIASLNMAFSSGSDVRSPAELVQRGKTSVLDPAEARQFIDAIDTTTVIGLPDRALIGLMVYSFSLCAHRRGDRDARRGRVHAETGGYGCACTAAFIDQALKASEGIAGLSAICRSLPRAPLRLGAGFDLLSLGLDVAGPARSGGRIDRQDLADHHPVERDAARQGAAWPSARIALGSTARSRNRHPRSLR